MKLKFSSSDRINTIFKQPLIDFRNVGNLLIFRGKVVDIRPKSVYAHEMTMIVHWTCININRKDVHI